VALLFVGFVEQIVEEQVLAQIVMEQNMMKQIVVEQLLLAQIVMKQIVMKHIAVEQLLLAQIVVVQIVMKHQLGQVVMDQLLGQCGAGCDLVCYGRIGQ